MVGYFYFFNLMLCGFHFTKGQIESGIRNMTNDSTKHLPELNNSVTISNLTDVGISSEDETEGVERFLNFVKMKNQNVNIYESLPFENDDSKKESISNLVERIFKRSKESDEEAVSFETAVADKLKNMNISLFQNEDKVNQLDLVGDIYSKKKINANSDNDREQQPSSLKGMKQNMNFSDSLSKQVDSPYKAVFNTPRKGNNEHMSLLRSEVQNLHQKKMDKLSCHQGRSYPLPYQMSMSIHRLIDSLENYIGNAVIRSIVDSAQNPSLATKINNSCPIEQVLNMPQTSLASLLDLDKIMQRLMGDSSINDLVDKPTGHAKSNLYSSNRNAHFKNKKKTNLFSSFIKSARENPENITNSEEKSFYLPIIDSPNGSALSPSSLSPSTLSSSNNTLPEWVKIESMIIDDPITKVTKEHGNILEKAEKTSLKDTKSAFKNVHLANEDLVVEGLVPIRDRNTELYTSLDVLNDDGKTKQVRNVLSRPNGSFSMFAVKSDRDLDEDQSIRGENQDLSSDNLNYVPRSNQMSRLHDTNSNDYYQNDRSLFVNEDFVSSVHPQNRALIIEGNRPNLLGKLYRDEDLQNGKDIKSVMKRKISSLYNRFDNYDNKGNSNEYVDMSPSKNFRDEELSISNLMPVIKRERRKSNNSTVVGYRLENIDGLSIPKRLAVRETKNRNGTSKSFAKEVAKNKKSYKRPKKPKAMKTNKLKTKKRAGKKFRINNKNQESEEVTEHKEDDDELVRKGGVSLPCNTELQPVDIGQKIVTECTIIELRLKISTIRTTTPQCTPETNTENQCDNTIPCGDLKLPCNTEPEIIPCETIPCETTTVCSTTTECPTTTPPCDTSPPCDLPDLYDTPPPCNTTTPCDMSSPCDSNSSDSDYEYK